MIAGALFSRYYLDEGIRQSEAWQSVSDADVASLGAALGSALAKVPAAGKLGEAETESLVIFPTLAALGWSLETGGRSQRKQGLGPAAGPRLGESEPHPGLAGASLFATRRGAHGRHATLGAADQRPAMATLLCWRRVDGRSLPRG